jgi:hypothetical protein
MKSVKYLAAALALTAATGAFAAYDDGASDSAFLKDAVAPVSTQAPAPVTTVAPVQHPDYNDLNNQIGQP